MDHPLQRHKDNFEDEQLRAVDQLQAQNQVDVDLQAAQNINLVTQQTRDKIQRMLPNHAEIFREARARFEREGTHGNLQMRNQLAFRRAFNQVYGRFLFDRENIDLTLNRAIEQRLAPVLKFPIDHAHWLDGRNELQSAIERARLFVLNHPTNANGTPNTLDTILEESFTVHGGHGPHQGNGPDLRAETSVHDANDAVDNAVKIQKKAEEAKNYFRDRSSHSNSINTNFITISNTINDRAGNPRNITGIMVNNAPIRMGDAEIGPIIEQLKEQQAQSKKDINEIRIPNGRQNNGQQAGQAAVDLIREQRDIRDANNRLIGQMARDIKTLEALQRNCTELYKNLFQFLEHAEFLTRHNFFPNGYTLADVRVFMARVEGLNPDKNPDIRVNDFIDVVIDLRGGHNNQNWLALLDNPIPNFNARLARITHDNDHAKSTLDERKHHLHEVRHLTDAQAAQRIMETVMRRQHPDLSTEQQKGLATMVIASDVSLIHNTDYEGLARRSSQQYLEILQSVEFRQRILSFKYKQGDKVVEPFKGLREEDLDDWNKIEALFNTGKLDLKGGMFLLAGLHEVIDERRQGTRTRINSRLRDMVVKLMAKELGVDKKMNNAGVAKVVNDAVDDALVKYRDTMRAFNIHYEKNHPDWDRDKVKLIKAKKKDLDERRRLGKLTVEEYEEEYADLREEIRELRAEGLKDYMEDPILHNFWNSPQAQWIRDGLHNIGRFTGKKALAVAGGTVEAAFRGIWGTTKLGAKFAYQAVATPFRIIKYPALFIAKPFVWGINKFKKEQIDLPGVFETMGNDLNRIGDYTKDKVNEVTKGTKYALTKSYVDKWDAVRYTDVPYKDRTKVDPATLNRRIEKLKGKADNKPIELSQAPDLNMEEYKGRLAKVLEMIEGGHGHDGVNNQQNAQNSPQNPQNPPSHPSPAPNANPATPANPAHHSQPNQQAA